MKTKIIVSACALFLLLAGVVLAGEPDNNNKWSSASAIPIEPGRLEVGLFQSVRLGISPVMELSSHPIFGFVIPNFALKWNHNKIGGFDLASRHSFIYPTPLLRLLAREGTGGFISPEFHIPHMASFYNEVLMSREISVKLILTGKVGFSFALKSGDLDDRSTIDLPVVFPRLAVYYHDVGFRSGIAGEGNLWRRWFYSADADVFFTPGGDENIAFEQKAFLKWIKSDGFQFSLGYGLMYGEYPFGTQWHLLGPLFDVKWAWQIW